MCAKAAATGDKAKIRFHPLLRSHVDAGISVADADAQERQALILFMHPLRSAWEWPASRRRLASTRALCSALCGRGEQFEGLSFCSSSTMIGPRQMGSPPTLKRQLSRLSSSSSVQVRQSNSRIYTFLLCGGLILLATVALLQLRAPQGSKLSPVESWKSDEGIVPEESWWNTNDGRNLLDLATGKERAAEKSMFGRKMGAVRFVKDLEEENSDEGVDVVDEMEADEDEDEEVDQQDLFGLDMDARMLEDEAEDPEDPDVGFFAEMSNEDSAEDSTGDSENLTNETVGKSGQQVSDNIVSAVSADKDGGERVDSAKSIGLDSVSNKKNSSIPTGHDREELETNESKQEDPRIAVNPIPDWVLDKKLKSQQEGIVGSLQEFERDLVKGLEKKKGSLWDHADTNHVAAEEGVAAKVAIQHLKGFKDFIENWKERFNSDDELIDENLLQRLEGVREIEDALLLNVDGAADKSTFSKKFDALPKKIPRGTFDHTNPTSNPMLQDPDTAPGTWMTKTDKEMLRAMRGDRSRSGQQPKGLLRGKILDVVAVPDSAVRRQASTR